MKWRLYLRRARELPPDVVVRKAVALAFRCAARQTRLVADHVRSTYGPIDMAGNSAARVVVRAEDIAADLESVLLTVGREYLAHRFDLLGSGWRAPTYGMRPVGFLGRRHEPNAPPEPDRSGRGLDAVVTRWNLPHARDCWALIDGDHYRPIDWQLDLRSGYRWSARRHSYRLGIPLDIGADVKVPWELGRLQHLPQLALCAILGAAGRRGFEPADRYIREIADQLLDFVGTNPPRFGVNWMSAMDVAIRAANVALTLALMAGAQMALKPEVEHVILASLRDHAAFVFEHLDYAASGRSNHYLADLGGLIWAAWMLADGAARDRWLAFAGAEIVKETKVQFLADGGSYEGSTNYHRLSAETVLFAIAILRALDLEVPADIFATLRKAAALSRAVQGSDGTIVQIGDTDSGRFFKLHPTALPSSFGGAAVAFIENALDHEGFIQAVDALDRLPPPGARLDAVVIARLAPTVPEPTIEPSADTSDFGELDQIEAEIAALPAAARRVRRFDLTRPLDPASWQRSAFPDFGLYLFRKDPDLLVAFRCSKGLVAAAPSGHTHDDNLALEYRLGPFERRDPGSFVYTPNVKLRNVYRSAAAHDVPRSTEWEVAPSGQELFALDHRAFAACRAWRPDGVAGEIVTQWGRILRLVRFTPTAIVVTDAVAPAQSLAAAAKLELSVGYGRLAGRLQSAAGR